MSPSTEGLRCRCRANLDLRTLSAVYVVHDSSVDMEKASEPSIEVELLRLSPKNPGIVVRRSKHPAVQGRRRLGLRLIGLPSFRSYVRLLSYLLNFLP